MASSMAAKNTRVAEKVLPLSSAANPFASATAVMASTGVSNSKIAERAEQQGSGVAAEIVACEKKGKVKATATIAIALEDNSKLKFQIPAATQFTFGTNDEVIAAAEEMEYIKPSKPAMYFGSQPAKPFEPLYTFELPKMKIKDWEKDSKLAAHESQTTTDFRNKPVLVKLENEDEAATTTEVGENGDEWEDEATTMALTYQMDENSQRIYAGVVHNSAQLKLTLDYIRDVEAIWSSLLTEVETSMSVMARDIGDLKSSWDGIAEGMVAVQDLALEKGNLHMDIMDSIKDMSGTLSSFSQEIQEIRAEVIDILACLPEDLAAKHDEWEDESDSLTQVLFPQGNGRWDFDGMIVQAGRGGGGGGGWCNVM